MAGKVGRGFIVWVSLAVAALTCGTVAFAVMQGPRTMTIEQFADMQAAKDPKIGTAFDIGGLTGSPVILVMLGDCTSCSLKRADFEELRQSGGFRVVGLHTRGALLKEFRAKHDWLELAEDELDLDKKLNAFFAPRAYAFDARGGLLAAQGGDESFEVFLSRLGGNR